MGKWFSIINELKFSIKSCVVCCVIVNSQFRFSIFKFPSTLTLIGDSSLTKKMFKLKNFLCAPKLLNRLKCESKMKTTEKSKVAACSLACSTLRGKRACWSFEMGLGRMTTTYSLTRTCIKPTNKLVNALLKHFWC